MSVSASYDLYRGRLETYFDRTAFDAWAKLTSDAPVSGIRATVRAGRDEMRARLLDWLPADLSGKRLLDAGCGTGALAVEAAKRGAHVVAVDVSAQLVNLARERLPANLNIDFRSGDMLGDDLGEFDHVVAMDSLIHYRFADIVAAATRLQQRTRGSLLFTVAPRTPMLLAMQAAGKAFPRSDRSPAIIPASPVRLMRDLAQSGWAAGRDGRTSTAFYKSHAIEMVRG